MKENLAKIPRNVFGVGFVGFFMQFGASLVYATGNVFVEGTLLSDYQLILVRGFSESVPHIIKVFSGYLSDRIRNRKLFLMFGYGSMIFFKICFFVCSLTWIFPLAFLSILYIITQILDRVMNCVRDSSRDALLVDSTPKHLLSISFAIRKTIASCGSIFSGLLAFFLIRAGLVTMTNMYFLAIFPVIIATLILHFMVKDVPWKLDDKKKEQINIDYFLILKHIVFNGLFGFLLWNNNFGFGSIALICIGSFTVYRRFSFINFKQMLILISIFVYKYNYFLSFGLIILSFLNLRFFGEKKYNPLDQMDFDKSLGLILIFIGSVFGNLPLFIYLPILGFGLLHINIKMSLIVGVISLLYSTLITFNQIKLLVFCLLSGLLLQIIPYFKTTESYSKLMSHKSKLREFFKILFVGLLLIMGKINDTVYFKQLCNFGISKVYTILVFVLIYIFISISSMIFGGFLQRNYYYSCGIFVFLALIGANLFLGFCGINNILFFIISVICSAICNGGMETVFTTMVSNTIPSKDLSATLFGLFYTFMGIFNFIGVTFFDYVIKNSQFFIKYFPHFLKLETSTNIQIAAKIIVIWPIIGLILFIIIKNKRFK